MFRVKINKQISYPLNYYVDTGQYLDKSRGTCIASFTDYIKKPFADWEKKSLKMT